MQGVYVCVRVGENEHARVRSPMCVSYLVPDVRACSLFSLTHTHTHLQAADASKVNAIENRSVLPSTGLRCRLCLRRFTWLRMVAVRWYSCVLGCGWWL